MQHYHFEDLAPGVTLTGGPVTVTSEDIVAFARAYDPQPFHLDEEAGRGSAVGGLIASGWHSCAIGMRLMADTLMLRASSMGSPGIDVVRWLRPVRPGVALSMRLVVRESRPSASKPDRGFVRFQLDLLEGGGERVMTQDFWVIFGRRGAAPLPPRVLPERQAPEPDLSDPGDAFPAGFIEDLPVGTTYDLGPYRFEREEVLAFARAFDPQPFHIDEAAARASHFGGLCASGWHTAAAWMSRMVAARDRGRAEALASGATIPASGPSPGFRDLKWLKPVYIGDTIRFALTLTEARPSRSRPGWGVVSHAATGVNQHGEAVFSFAGAWLGQARG
ncbi:MaoC family dehydratase [Methylobacterium oryzisoli]|uniref:MaoC family dehydratase n=1 Tax=Methylobacterium oryzisoli TaxID=3385502 RepID=UPI0038914C5B